MGECIKHVGCAIVDVAVYGKVSGPYFYRRSGHDQRDNCAHLDYVYRREGDCYDHRIWMIFFPTNVLFYNKVICIKTVIQCIAAQRSANKKGERRRCEAFLVPLSPLQVPLDSVNVIYDEVSIDSC